MIMLLTYHFDPRKDNFNMEEKLNFFVIEDVGTLLHTDCFIYLLLICNCFIKAKTMNRLTRHINVYSPC